MSERTDCKWDRGRNTTATASTNGEKDGQSRRVDRCIERSIDRKTDQQTKSFDLYFFTCVVTPFAFFTCRCLDNWRLLNCTLYTTVEPCTMCLSALLAARVSRLVYGSPDVRLGGVRSWVPLLEKKHPFHSIAVTEGVLGEEAQSMMVNFFRGRRGELSTDEIL
mmetsp:Transcript_45664/g.89947  ORF Transcript_45664/g.89947 Transcript_45664/m.89947 type:complete len:164 (+) Transcript_45664:123-614(+)